MLALGAMAVDHLLGEADDEETYALDYGGFAISAALCVLAAVVLYGWVVPRARRAGREGAARDGLVLSVLSVLPGFVFVWLGFPIVIAAAGVELGLEGRRGGRRTVATTAVVVGGALIAFAVLYYGVAAIGHVT